MSKEWEELIRLMPDGTGKTWDWAGLEKTVLSPLFENMADTQQEKEWHGEGDVYTHTKLVCEKLVRMEAYRKLNERLRREVALAALLHDVGKIRTTVTEDGRLVSPHHGSVGSRLARALLWTEFDLAGNKEAQRMRETICWLIRWHTLPVNALRKNDPVLFLRSVAADGEMIPDASIALLCLLAEADVLGRVAPDTQEQLDAIRLCRMQAEEAGCLSRPYAFPDDHTGHAYLSGRNVPAEVPLYDDTWGCVTMVCGLPGTGKDTWIGENAGDAMMLSLDAIRRGMKIKPTDEQGTVLQEGKQRAREMLAKHIPFVFNATNVTGETRSKWITLFEQYRARVRIVYLETGWQENLRRNAGRREAVPESAILNMLKKMTLPERREAQAVEWADRE